MARSNPYRHGIALARSRRNQALTARPSGLFSQALEGPVFGRAQGRRRNRKLGAAALEAEMATHGDGAFVLWDMRASVNVTFYITCTHTINNM